MWGALASTEENVRPAHIQRRHRRGMPSATRRRAPKIWCSLSLSLALRHLCGRCTHFEIQIQMTLNFTRSLTSLCNADGIQRVHATHIAQQAAQVHHGPDSAACHLISTAVMIGLTFSAAHTSPRMRAPHDTARHVQGRRAVGHGRERAAELCRAQAKNTNTNTNTKYTCDTGQTRNKLLAQWVHLTNHAAGHSRPGTAHLTA